MNLKRILVNLLAMTKPGQVCTAGYIDAVKTVSAAKKAGMSVGEYVEMIWDQQGQTRQVISNLLSTVAAGKLISIVEIGPGTGRYLELLLEQVKPQHYEIYETAEDWVDYLSQQFQDILTIRQADGVSLGQTADKSCQLVHAHGVFVYLKYIQAFRYFSEMCRICAEQGYIFFDYYSEIEMNPQTLEKWMKSGDDYAVVLDRNTVNNFFDKNGFDLLAEFQNKHGHGFSRYALFGKRN